MKNTDPILLVKSHFTVYCTWFIIGFLSFSKILKTVSGDLIAFGGNQFFKWADSLVASHCFWILGDQNYWLWIIDWLWIFPCIKLSWHSCSMWEKPGWLWQFDCEGLFSFNLKEFYYSYVIWSRRLYEERTSFCTGLISRKLCRFVYFWLAFFTQALTSFSSIDCLLHFMHGFWFHFFLSEWY